MRRLPAHSQNKNARLVAALLAWFAVNARDLPWRRTSDPYAIWVSEIMLQQTQVKTVIPFWERWLRTLPSIAAVAQAPLAQIHKLWEGLGYYTRVRNLQRAAQIIVAGHGGQFPQNFDEVLALPGIGRYTAGAICSIAFNQPTPILDGNVIRVLTRVFGIADNPKEKQANARLWQLAAELVTHAQGVKDAKVLFPLRPLRSLREENSRTRTRTRMKDDQCSHLNQSLMELGALVCTPRSPQCASCPVKSHCVAFRENRVAALPNLGKRAVAMARRWVAFVVERDGKFLVRQRPAGVVNAHLWEFPNVETNATPAELPAVFQSELGLTVPELVPLCTIKHSITRYRITLAAFAARLELLPAPAPGHWKTTAQMQRLAFTSAHRKIVRTLTSPPNR